MKRENKRKKNSFTKKMVISFIVIILCAFFGIGTYYITLAIDKARKGGEVNITVTFDDTESYVIPNTNTLTEDEALKEWPYIFKIENTGNAKGLYQIRIKDLEDSNISRKVLEYSLYKDDVKTSFGHLSDLKDDLLYTYEIEGETDQEYKLYIWVGEDEEKDTKELKYEYKLELTVIKDGGPGF